MEKMKIEAKGLSPLMMHNGRLVNPLNQYSKAIKEISGKPDDRRIRPGLG